MAWAHTGAFPRDASLIDAEDVRRHVELCRRRGYPITEVPVLWHFPAPSGDCIQWEDPLSLVSADVDRHRWERAATAARQELLRLHLRRQPQRHPEGTCDPHLVRLNRERDRPRAA